MHLQLTRSDSWISNSVPNRNVSTTGEQSPHLNSPSFKCFWHCEQWARSDGVYSKNLNCDIHKNDWEQLCHHRAIPHGLKTTRDLAARKENVLLCTCLCSIRSETGYMEPEVKKDKKHKLDRGEKQKKSMRSFFCAFLHLLILPFCACFISSLWHCWLLHQHFTGDKL